MVENNDIQGLKNTMMRAISVPVVERRRRMRALRRRVHDHDVQDWARRFLAALDAAPGKPVDS